MKDGPSIAIVAALIGDPARANMLTALMDGRAFTISELGAAAGVTLPTASEHLARLGAAGLVVSVKQGRHRYVRLSGHDVALLLEQLMTVAARTGAARTRAGPSDVALREARVCYDHLAGRSAVLLAEAARAHGLVDGQAITDAGHAFFAARGIVLARSGRRAPSRECLDWSERRHHLGGRLGAAVLNHVLARGWAKRGAGRVIIFGSVGAQAFDELVTGIG